MIPISVWIVRKRSFQFSTCAGFLICLLFTSWISIICWMRQTVHSRGKCLSLLLILLLIYRHFLRYGISKFSCNGHVWIFPLKTIYDFKLSIWLRFVFHKYSNWEYLVIYTMEGQNCRNLFLLMLLLLLLFFMHVQVWKLCLFFTIRKLYNYAFYCTLTSHIHTGCPKKVETRFNFLAIEDKHAV